jgi:hypothetical protein
MIVVFVLIVLNITSEKVHAQQIEDSQYIGSGSFDCQPTPNDAVVNDPTLVNTFFCSYNEFPFPFYNLASNLNAVCDTNTFINPLEASCRCGIVIRDPMTERDLACQGCSFVTPSSSSSSSVVVTSNNITTSAASFQIAYSCGNVFLDGGDCVGRNYDGECVSSIPTSNFYCTPIPNNNNANVSVEQYACTYATNPTFPFPDVVPTIFTAICSNATIVEPTLDICQEECYIFLDLPDVDTLPRCNSCTLLNQANGSDGYFTNDGSGGIAYDW